MDYVKFMSDKMNSEFEKSGVNLIYPAFQQEIIMLKMRDGIKLKTIIYRPVLEDGSLVVKPLPVILQRTCYAGHVFSIQIHGENLAKRGYIYISQYCRGIGGSEGVWEPNINERFDGLDTVNWLDEQEWVEAIGYYGSSYLALTGWAIADAVPEKVKGMCLAHYGTDRFASAYEKGMFRQDVLTAWAKDNAGFPVVADNMESYKFMPQVEVDEKMWGKRLPWYREWIINTHRHDAYWQQGWWKELYDIPSRIKIPLYILSGWYDHHHGSTMNTWDRLSNQAKSHSWLDIGAWNHAFIPCVEERNTQNLGGSEILAMLEWFELILKQKQIPQPRYRTYVTGADRWMNLNSWPVEESEKIQFYFHAQKMDGYTGSLNTAINSYRESDTFLYDPDNPVISHGSEALLANMKKNGSLLQPEPGYRPDVLSFVSEPMREDICICGKIKVKLYVSTDVDDTAFTAKVVEVVENGKAYNIRSSITSICHDIGCEYQPGSVIEVQIDMWDIVYELKKGSRLRVDISSSDFPQYHIHSNYAGTWSLQERKRIANQTIYYGAGTPSVIELPVIQSLV